MNIIMVAAVAAATSGNTPISSISGPCSNVALSACYRTSVAKVLAPLPAAQLLAT